MAPLRTLIASIFVVTCAGCAATPEGHSPGKDLGLLWVKHAAEYTAITMQVFKMAELALPGFIEDTSWSALPGQTDAAHLPTAVILDVDETVVSNVDFQIEYERPFANWKLEEWSSRVPPTPIAGVQHFARAAQNAGVTLFFLTNRPCEAIEGIEDPCPQKQTTLNSIAELGINTDANHVMLSNERPEWSREKHVRRELIARSHRVIMLVGDDLQDFIPCVRIKVAAPCTEAATATSRQQAIELFRKYWGNGWYVLPNPMHGSWTRAQQAHQPAAGAP